MKQSLPLVVLPVPPVVANNRKTDKKETSPPPIDTLTCAVV